MKKQRDFEIDMNENCDKINGIVHLWMISTLECYLCHIIAITPEIRPSMSTRYHQNSNTISKMDLVTPVLAT